MASSFWSEGAEEEIRTEDPAAIVQVAHRRHPHRPGAERSDGPQPAAFALPESD